MSKITDTQRKDHYIYSFSKVSPSEAIGAYKRKMAFYQTKINNFILLYGKRKTKEKMRIRAVCDPDQIISRYKSLDDFCDCSDFMGLTWNTIQLVRKFYNNIIKD